MAKGDRFYLNSFVFYDFEGAHYTRIRAATFRREFRPAAPDAADSEGTGDASID